MEECPAHSRFFMWGGGAGDGGRFGWVEDEEMDGRMRRLGVAKRTSE